MGNPNLTKILFAALLGTFVLATLFGIYLGFCTFNGCSIQEPYNSVFKNMSDSYTQLSGLAGTTSGDTGIASRSLSSNIYGVGKGILAGLTTSINVFVVGLQAIVLFFEMIPIISNIINVLTLVLPSEFLGLMALLSTIFAVYIAMQYIKSVTNKIELP